MDGCIKNDMDLELSEQEYKDTKQFLNELLDNHGYEESLQNGAKFMRAKKFNVQNALDLYLRYKTIRNKENLFNINPYESNVLKELHSKKFTFLLKPDKSTGASVCIFTAKLHYPSMTTHQNTLKGLVFQLDSALSTVSAQKNGLIFIYNMNGSLYSNFDLQLSFKILNLLKGGYPARLCKVIILTPPLWFRASFNLIRVFVREKLQDRISIVTSLTELHGLVEKSILPRSLAVSDDENDDDVNDDIDVVASRVCVRDRDEADRELHFNWLAVAMERSGYCANGQVKQNSEDVTEMNLEEQSEKKDEEEEDVEFELISESSWDMNLEVGLGDEDVMRDNNNDASAGIDEEKTPVMVMDGFKALRGPGVLVQRRDAVRRDSYLTKYRTKNSLPPWSLYKDSHTPCLHGDGSDNGVGISDFVRDEKYSFYSILSEFRTDSLYGPNPTFSAYSAPINQTKNRYSDIHCTDLSRVRLIRASNSTRSAPPSALIHTSPIPTDYIHANWVDGYRQKNAYICTQGPLNSTQSDFWHMILQYRIPVIVMTTRPREQNRDKCSQYWPEEVGKCQRVSGPTRNLYDEFEVTNLRSREFGPHTVSPLNKGTAHTQSGTGDASGDGEDAEEFYWYRVTLLHIVNLRTKQEHRVNHFYFHSWPDQGIPQSSEGFLNFILQIRHTYTMNIAKLGYDSEMDQEIPPPPILVHCSAGIGRTGTYIVTEICCKSLSDCGRFNLHDTMLKVRSQRHKCVQNAYQYLFCRNTIIDYAREMGLLPPVSTTNHYEEEDGGEEGDKNQSEQKEDDQNEDDKEEDDEDFCMEIPEVELEEEVYDNEEEEEEETKVDATNNDHQVDGETPKQLTEINVTKL